MPQENRDDMSRIVSLTRRETAVEGNSYVAHVMGSIGDDNDALKTTLSHLEPHLSDPRALVAQIPLQPGHFSLVLVGHDEKFAYLIADAIGSRPLYYARTSNGWAWSSQIKALVPILENRAADFRGIDEIFLYRWLMADHTLLSGVCQVLPSNCVYLRPGHPPLVSRYARVDFCPAPEPGNEADLIGRTSDALDNYFVRLRKKRSRVGILFSGGVDSSLLVAKAREHDFERLIAVTAGWPGRTNVEADRAAQIARHLGVEHRIVDVADSFVAGYLPELVRCLERPPRHFNYFGLAGIFSAIRSEVDFVVHGEGADRLFGTPMMANINRYEAKQRLLGRLPMGVRRATAAALGRIVPHRSGLVRRLRDLLENDTRDFIRRMSAYESTGGNDRIRSADLVPDLEAVRASKSSYCYAFTEPPAQVTQSALAYEQNLRFFCAVRQHIQDFYALASSYDLMIGFPFLAQEMMDIGLGLQDSLKIDSMGAKPILKKLACRYMPAEWVYMDKTGFEAPITDWLREPLAEHRAILFDSRTAARRLYDPNVLRRLDIDRDYNLIWTAMSLEIFLRQFVDQYPLYSWR